MELLILEKGFLLVVELNKVFNKIQEISWSDVIEFLCTFGQSLVQLNNSAVNSHNSVNYDVVSCVIFLDFDFERFHNRVDDHCELLSDLNQPFLGPVSEPIDDTSVEQGRGRSCSV